ncbi:M12 family metallo-peptidase [Paenibacillus tengchongensis]|uniref:M12 family metallo-peptidase n=1 Tax=Paenibacillus tengchongensis TaxID=2608684 RepID=UPI00124D1541|nr:M12 family metallo-peptidase [Paenibacillus tengchongensis]
MLHNYLFQEAYRFRTSHENYTPNVERSSIASVYDENGNIVGTHIIEKNISDAEENNIQSRAASGRLCKVLVAVDEEYRAKHSNWMSLTESIVEAADDAFNRDFGIDLTVTDYRYWTSSGSNAYQTLNNLMSTYSSNSYDFVIGFTAETDFIDNYGIQLAGKAQDITSNPMYGSYAVNWDQNDTYSDWHSLQHEISHLYSLQHDIQGPSPLCIMNYGTIYSTSSWDTDHYNQLAVRVGWYGTSIN